MQVAHLTESRLKAWLRNTFQFNAVTDGGSIALYEILTVQWSFFMESLDVLEAGFLSHTCAVQTEAGILFTNIQGRIQFHVGVGAVFRGIQVRMGVLCRGRAINGV